MNIAYYKKLEPLFGAWTITRRLRQDGCGQVFEVERKDGGTVQRAALKVVFVPRKKSDVRQRMEEMQQTGEPAAFLQWMVRTSAQEIAALTQLKGQKNILACRDHQVVERENKSGADIFIFTELLPTLPEYLRQHAFTEAEAIRLGIDICRALEACRQAGIVHGAVTADAVYVSPGVGFKLGGFGLYPASPDAAAPDAAEDVCALGKLLYALTGGETGAALPQAAYPAGRSPRLESILRSVCETDPAKRCMDPAGMRRQLEQLLVPPNVPALPQNGAAPARGPAPQRPAAPARSVPAAPRGSRAPSAAVPQAPAAVRQKQPPKGAAQGRGNRAAVPPAAPQAAEPKPKTNLMRFAVAGAALLVFLTVGGIAAGKYLLPRLRAEGDAEPEDAVNTAATAQPEPEQTAEPTLSPEEVEAAERESRIQQVLETMEGICTGTSPEITDPATWNEAGKALMDRLEADPYYQEWGFTASAAAFAENGADAGEGSLRSEMYAQIGQWSGAEGVSLQAQYPYLIAVNRAASTVTVYTPDEEGRYTVPYMAMVCSGGPGTPTGFWFTPIRYQWRTLVGPCYGQNATRIWDSYLFHSVPYYTQHKDDVEYDQFNQLGTQASLGCIRLAMVDVKWIFDNCPLGTPVVIYDDENDPGPMGKPGTIYTDPADETMRGWDPTDPDPANPWDDKYLPGTAIRSQAAWDEYNAAMADGRWNGTVNVTDLQGWSTDSSVEGTRG